jgi:hypothetical protein
MRNKDYANTERYLKKEALRKGVYVKEVNMPVSNFVQLFKRKVVPFLTVESVSQVVEQALKSCNSLYKDEYGTDRVNVHDSNMPGLVENKFDLLNAYLLNEINNKKELNEQEQSATIEKLCYFIEDLAER